MSGKYDRKDHLYQKAKDEGFRSRASYKLRELDQKFHLMRSGTAIIDLGAWPGGWIQVASQRVGAGGVIVGIDLVEIEGFSAHNVRCITGDVRDEENLQDALEFSGRPFDLVLSDMSPKLTGIREVDSIAAIGCAELALWAAGRLLRHGGNFVVKVFKSNDTEAFVKSSRLLFNKLVRVELDATRKTSKEFYLVGLGFKEGLSSQRSGAVDRTADLDADLDYEEDTEG